MFVVRTELQIYASESKKHEQKMHEIFAVAVCDVAVVVVAVAIFKWKSNSVGNPFMFLSSWRWHGKRSAPNTRCSLFGEILSFSFEMQLKCHTAAEAAAAANDNNGNGNRRKRKYMKLRWNAPAVPVSRCALSYTKCSIERGIPFVEVRECHCLLRQLQLNETCIASDRSNRPRIIMPSMRMPRRCISDTASSTNGLDCALYSRNTILLQATR